MLHYYKWNTFFLKTKALCVEWLHLSNSIKFSWNISWSWDRGCVYNAFSGTEGVEEWEWLWRRDAVSVKFLSGKSSKTLITPVKIWIGRVPKGRTVLALCVFKPEFKGITNSPNNIYNWKDYVEKNIFTRGNNSSFQIQRLAGHLKQCL